MAGHGVTFTATGALPSPYGPIASPTQQQIIRFFGVSVTNTNTQAGSIILRDGGSSGSIVAAFPLPGQVTGPPALPGCVDQNYAIPRTVSNGIYVEVDGPATVNGTVWIS